MTDAPSSPIAPLPRDPRADAVTPVVPPTTDAFPAPGSVPVCVMVPSLNEADGIGPCLASLAWAEQLIVIDSGSSDDTTPIAQAHGADVYRFDYPNDSPTGWPKKRNWALDRVPFRHDWVFLVDADEHATPELAHEVHRTVTADDPSPSGYWVNRRMIFRGRWVRFGGYYPAWNLRLFKHPLGRFERITEQGDTNSGDMEVHEHVRLADGSTPGFLDHDLLHYEITDVFEWVHRHNRYSSWEAHAELEAASLDGIQPRLLGTPQQRRRWMKHAVRQLPFRPTIRFTYHYVLRGGFREGMLGFQLARLLAAYETMTLAKRYELKAPKDLSR